MTKTGANQITFIQPQSILDSVIVCVPEDALRGLAGENRTDQIFYYPESHDLYYQRRAGSSPPDSISSLYLFGNSSSGGLLHYYINAGLTVTVASQYGLRYLLSTNVVRQSILDLTLIGLPATIVFHALDRDCRVIGYRHPLADHKSVATYMVAQNLKGSANYTVPRQVFIPPGCPPLQRLCEAAEAALDSSFVICRGDLSASSRDGSFPHLVARKGSLWNALRAYQAPRKGIVISELVLSDTSQWYCNAAFHKVHFIRTSQPDTGEMFIPLAPSHYLIPNHIDLALIDRRGYTTLSEATRCFSDHWLTASAADLPNLELLGLALAQLNPLSSLLSVDLMLTELGHVAFFEANHFAATFMDPQFTGIAPIELGALSALNRNDTPAGQLAALARLEDIFDGYLEERFLTIPTIVDSRGINLL